MKLKKLSAAVAMVLALSLLTVSAFAANVASVQAQTAPTTTDTVTDDDGNEVALEVTALADAEEAPTEEATEELQNAYSEILDADSVEDLFEDTENATAFNEAVEEINPNATEANIEVVSVFDVSLSDGTTVTGSVTFSVKYTIPSGKGVIVLHRLNGVWEVVKSVVSGSTITITSPNGLSPFAIVLVDETSSSSSSDDTLKQTGESASSVAVVASVAFIGLAGIFTVLSRKRENG